MTTALEVLRAGPLVTLQDAGRPGLLGYGVSASGPMDRAAFERAAGWIGNAAATGVEFTTVGLTMRVAGNPVSVAADGGDFRITVNTVRKAWPARLLLKDGDVLDITPGKWGNYGYLRFDREIDVPMALGSRATNSIAAIGGMEGRALAAGDKLALGAALPKSVSQHPRARPPITGPIRVIWGLHADRFDGNTRQRLLSEPFAISQKLDRMGVRLDDRAGVFAGKPILSLVSDAIVPGDIQVLGDGTPTVLMRDHQPTGGYPRIATIIAADFDRFAQLRPDNEVRFQSVTVAHAQVIAGVRP